MPATPALLLDPDALQRNLEAMAVSCRTAGVALRPHVKGHKSPALARRQLAAGAVGVAAATLGEAAAMLAGGVADVLLTSALPPARAADAVALAGAKGPRVATETGGQAADAVALAGANRPRVATETGGQAWAEGRGGLRVVVHDPALVAALAREAAAAGLGLEVLLDVDVGQRRGGVAPGAPALALAAAVEAAPALRLVGVQGYEGHLQAIAGLEERRAASGAAMELLAEWVAGLRDAGYAVPWVTTAGTGTAALAAPHPAVTEVQPGSYALMDAAYARVDGVGYEQAVWVEASVLAVLGPEEAIVDAGLKALSVDAGPAAVAPPRRARYEPAGDEHGRLTGALGGLRVGDRVRLVPSHADTTVLLHDAFHLPDGTQLAIAG